MEKLFRPRHWTMLLIVGLHVVLLALVFSRPKAPRQGLVTFVDLMFVPVRQPKPEPVAAPQQEKRKATTRVAGTTAAPPPEPAAQPVVQSAVAGPAVQAVETAANAETVAPDFAGGKAPLDLDKMRRQAGVNDKTRDKTVAEMAQATELRRRSIESKVAAAAEAGKRKDCQSGYSGMGILAIIPIIYGTVTDNGCKWK